MGAIVLVVLTQGSTAQSGSGVSLGFAEPPEMLVQQVLTS